MGIAGILLIVVIAVTAWQVSLVLWPMKACPRCRGARRLSGHGDVFRWCARCGATGHVRRLGARKEQ